MFVENLSQDILKCKGVGSVKNSPVVGMANVCPTTGDPTLSPVDKDFAFPAMTR